LIIDANQLSNNQQPTFQQPTTNFPTFQLSNNQQQTTVNFDYDLVIIGGSVAGVYAAKTAAQLKARVALVQPLQETGFLQQEVCRFQGQRFSLSSELSFYDLPVGEPYSPAILASLGIDVIIGEGQFCPKPRLAFEVKDRLLRSRSYLLAPAAIPAIPNYIEGLNRAKVEQLNQEVLANCIDLNPLKNTDNSPKHLIVIGGIPQGIEIAHSFARIGYLVTIIVSSDRLLTEEDAEAAFLIQCQLEADGIRLLTNTSVSQIKQINDKIWVQAGDKALEADQVYLATGNQPNLESLNLDRVGVETVNHDSLYEELILNKKLQTTRFSIYSCSHLSQKYGWTNLAIHEANIAIKNALFWPIYSIKYHHIPWAIFTYPQFARVGLTEAQATEKYGKDIQVFRHYFKNITAAQLSGETTGICKVITRRNGQLLGVHLVGNRASELIHSWALAMQNKLKIGAIASLPHIFPSLSEINSQTAQLWQYHQRIRPWENLLEGFFNWRRG
jgi:pyruvate/2-oxoglutarate dehydrogenase complex dihydrolipoamide dehydrogenase (E3) component